MQLLLIIFDGCFICRAYSIEIPGLDNCMVVFQAAEAYKKSTLGMKSMEDELEKLEDALDAEEEVTVKLSRYHFGFLNLAHYTLEYRHRFYYTHWHLCGTN